jgi:hypothetical protein
MRGFSPAHALGCWKPKGTTILKLYRVLLTGGDCLFLDRVEAFRNGQNFANAAGAYGNRSGIEVVAEEYDPNLPHSFAANSSQDPCLICRHIADSYIHSLPLIEDDDEAATWLVTQAAQQGKDLTAQMLEPLPWPTRIGRRPSWFADDQSNPTLFPEPLS